MRSAGLRIFEHIGAFQWRNAVAHKGSDNARHHIGVTAQPVQDAFTAEGADPHCWGIFCADQTDEGEQLCLRMDQLTLLLLACLRGEK